MAINFSKDRWAKIEKDYTAWWEGKLERPLINIELYGVDSGMPKPDESVNTGAASYHFGVPVETIIRQWDYMLSSIKYVGDGYPNILPDFGPGVNAAFMGAKGTVTPQTIWFEAEQHVPMEELHFEFNPQELWYQRIKQIYEAAGAHFKGNVCLGMTHMNNGIDPVARFFSAEEMALAFYDDPDALKRLIWENHDLFFKYYDELTKAMGAENSGHTCWFSIFSKEPHFFLQSDFCVMISPKQFEEFILPELRACCRKLGNPFYHLDGTDQLKHLDMILDIPELKGVQWVPEAGKPSEEHWPEVYQKIRKAGKLVQFSGGLNTLDVIADHLGSAEGLYFNSSFHISEEDKVMRLLEKYGAV